jgi:hypothetical protein
MTLTDPCRRRAHRTFAFLSCAVALLASCSRPEARLSDVAQADSVVWRFDRLQGIGGRTVRVEGDPKVVRSEIGRAILFDGVDDALFLDAHPLAGARTFTVEAIFRPDGGAFEQRWLHLAEAGGAAAAGHDPPVDPSGPRLMFEIRVAEGRWYLDAFATGPGYRQVLMFREKAYPLGRWYHVAQVYDGRSYRSYVNGVLQGEAAMAFTPQGEGHSSVGTRINRRDYFRGALFTAESPEVEERLVPPAGVEPARLAALDFESSASTNSATGARRGC